MLARTNPKKPCTKAELQMGLAYAQHVHKMNLHSGTLRAIFNRAQQGYENGRKFMSAARYEARQLRIDRREFEAIVGAVCEMGRFRQGSVPTFTTRGGPLSHELVPANDRALETDQSFLRHDMMLRPRQASPPKPEQLDLI